MVLWVHKLSQTELLACQQEPETLVTLLLIFSFIMTEMSVEYNTKETHLASYPIYGKINSYTK